MLKGKYITQFTPYTPEKIVWRDQVTDKVRMVFPSALKKVFYDNRQLRKTDYVYEYDLFETCSLSVEKLVLKSERTCFKSEHHYTKEDLIKAFNKNHHYKDIIQLVDYERVENGDLFIEFNSI